MTIRLTREERAIVVAVEDSGRGIPEDQLDTVFDRYSRSADSGGSGLGLAIAKSLVEVHGGSIEAANAGERAPSSASGCRSPSEREYDRGSDGGGAMAKVLILAGDAAEDLETMFVKYRLVEAGHEPYVAAPTTRPIKLVVHDFEPDFDTYVEKPGGTCPVDVAFADVDPSDFAAVVIPGGRAPEFIRVDPEVRRIVEHFFAEDKPVGTLCHGPQVPAALGLLRGRRSSGFPALAPDLEMAGAEYVDGAAVVDGNMVSCRGWGDLAEWSRAFLECLDRAAVPA